MTQKGNSPEKWEKLLKELDEKLQLGLLDRLRRVSSYFIESDTLIIQTSSKEDFAYLSKDAVKHQLQIFASDSLGVTSVKVEPPGMTE